MRRARWLEKGLKVEKAVVAERADELTQLRQKLAHTAGERDRLKADRNAYLLRKPSYCDDHAVQFIIADIMRQAGMDEVRVKFEHGFEDARLTVEHERNIYEPATCVLFKLKPLERTKLELKGQLGQ